MIAGSLDPDSVLKVIAGNHCNPINISISFQEFITKPKKRRIWNAVILKDNGTLFFPENRIQATRNPIGTAKVRL